MDKSVTLPRSTLAQVELDNALQAAKHYSKRSRADSTWRAYRSDWRRFEVWCQSVALQSLPAEPDTVAMFVASEADDGLNPSTLNRRLAAIEPCRRPRPSYYSPLAIRSHKVRHVRLESFSDVLGSPRLGIATVSYNVRTNSGIQSPSALDVGVSFRLNHDRVLRTNGR